MSNHQNKNQNASEYIYRIKETESGFLAQYRERHWLMGFICGWHNTFFREDPLKTKEEALADAKRWEITTAKSMSEQRAKPKPFTKYHKIEIN